MSSRLAIVLPTRHRARPDRAGRPIGASSSRLAAHRLPSCSRFPAPGSPAGRLSGTLLLLFLLLPPSSRLLPPAAADALWDRAIGVATANRLFVPGRWSERRQVFNVKDELHLESEIVVTISPTDTGRVAVALERAVTNGTDITAEMRKTFNEQKDRFHLRNPAYNPFHPSHQGGILKARPDGRTRAIGAALLVAYAYRQRTDEGTWEGVAWIDEVSGRPASLTARMLGLPKMIDGDERHEYVLNVDYDTGPEETWHISRIVTSERATLNSFPYSNFYGRIETSIALGKFWKIEFH